MITVSINYILIITAIVFFIGLFGVILNRKNRNINCILIPGNFRVCLVQLRNSMKLVVSCATNAQAVLQNSTVYHDSTLVKKVRKTILKYDGRTK